MAAPVSSRWLWGSGGSVLLVLKRECDTGGLKWRDRLWVSSLVQSIILEFAQESFSDAST